MPQWVLNSASPRRRELIGLLPGIWQFDAIEVPENDTAPGLPPEQQVALLARRKAEAARGAWPLAWILGADTLVAARGHVLGKPRDREDARHMLRMLSGNHHQVYTGLHLLSPRGGQACSGVACTRVQVAPLSDWEIEAYLDTGEPFDKAGAYGIQGAFARHVTGIEGCYFNVVGLPVARLYEMLRHTGDLY